MFASWFLWRNLVNSILVFLFWLCRRTCGVCSPTTDWTWAPAVKVLTPQAGVWGQVKSHETVGRCFLFVFPESSLTRLEGVLSGGAVGFSREVLCYQCVYWRRRIFTSDLISFVSTGLFSFSISSWVIFLNFFPGIILCGSHLQLRWLKLTAAPVPCESCPQKTPPMCVSGSWLSSQQRLRLVDPPQGIHVPLSLSLVFFPISFLMFSWGCFPVTSQRF